MKIRMGIRMRMVMVMGNEMRMRKGMVMGIKIWIRMEMRKGKI